jgi:hypothetical protein
MSAPSTSYLVTAAFAGSGEVTAWRVTMAMEQVERLTQTLGHMADLGTIASFGIVPDAPLSHVDVLDQLRRRCGGLLVDACLDSVVPSRWLQPAFLMPIWPFDHEIDGRPASTGQLLGLDLELNATPSPGEERGAILPGRIGRWLIDAHTMF